MYKTIRNLMKTSGKSKGFTLVELMVVVAILAVLMTIVFPAVTGTKEASTAGQVMSDAEAVQKGVDNFQNKGIKPSFPEQALGTTYATSGYVGAVATSLVFKDKAGNTVTVDTSTHKEMNWDATTNVWQPSGSVNSVTFVPDFVLRKPSSLPLENEEGVVTTSGGSTELKEFLWLMKVNEAGTADESRTVQVYRLTAYAAGTATYTLVY